MLIQEAARLAHEAERILAIAEERSIAAEADQQSYDTAHKRAALLFGSAVELWREARDFAKLMAAVEELTRIYSVLGDDRAVVACLQAEEQFWIAEGDRPRQAATVLLLSIRQGQADDHQEAIRSAARALEIARSAGLDDIEAQAVGRLWIEHHASGKPGCCRRVRPRGH